MKRLDSRGFTIIELVIATAVFATILLLCSIALLQISRVYYKGVTTTRTQRRAVAIVNQIAQSIQFGGGTVVTSLTPQNGSQGFCVAGKRYSFKPDTEYVTSGPDANQLGNGLLADVQSCGGGLRPQDMGAGGTLVGDELLEPHIRIRTLILCGPGENTTRPIECANAPAAGSKTYQITLSLVYGDNAVLNAAHDTCLGNAVGGQFCARSDINTIVQKRVE